MARWAGCAVCRRGLLWRVLHDGHGAWSRLSATASGRARGDADQPVRNRNGRHLAGGDGQAAHRPDPKRYTPEQRPAPPYAALFLFYAATVAAGLLVYLLSQDRTD